MSKKPETVKAWAKYWGWSVKTHEILSAFTQQTTTYYTAENRNGNFIGKYETKRFASERGAWAAIGAVKRKEEKESRRRARAPVYLGD